KKGLRVRTRIALGPPGDAILGAVQTSGANLVAMTTHERSGLRRALVGSVAESVPRASPVPVLGQKPRVPRTRSTATRRRSSAISIVAASPEARRSEDPPSELHPLTNPLCRLLLQTKK